MLRLPYSLFALALTTLATFATLAGVTALAGCSDDSSTGGTSSGNVAEGGGGTDGGGKTDGGGGTDSSVTDTGAADTSTGGLNDCNNFVDRSAAGASRTITWTFPLTVPERCMTIKKGQEVTWAGDFLQHPLQVKGGDTPNPISTVDTMTGKVSFPTAGNFGFECGVHPTMIGVIKVIE